MSVLTRTRPTTSEHRKKLTEAHANVAAAHAAVNEAEAAQDDATLAYRRAKNAVSDIEERMESISGKWNTVHPLAREDLKTKHDECLPALTAAKLPLMELGVAVEKAELQAGKARQRLAFDQARLHDAAVATVQAEVPALAQPMLDQVEAAFATILEHGPNLFCQINSRLLPTDALDPNITRQLNIATTEWPEFGRRFQTSHWRNVVAVLEQDADAPLHVGPVG